MRNTGTTWKLGGFGYFKAMTIFAKHIGNPDTLRKMWRSRGDQFPLYGGQAHCSFSSVKALMASEPEKLHGVFAPSVDAETYFSQGSMIFLQKGPNHSLRRAHVIERVEFSRTRLSRMNALLRDARNTHAAVAHFLLENLAGIEPTPQEVEDLMYFRDNGPKVVLLPPWLRRLVLSKKDRRCAQIRSHFLDRFAAARLAFADSIFDAIWFNAGTLHFYPEKVLLELEKDPGLLAVVRQEIDNDPQDRPQTRALVMEVLRIHSRIASVNVLHEGELKFGLIATGVMDPERFAQPEKIDLSRDHSDSLSFALPAPQRSCPGRDLAPEMMACVVAHLLHRKLNPG